VTKAKACKGPGQEWSLGVTFCALGSVRECEEMNPTLPSELPLWELESQWTPESLEGNCKSQISLDWRIFYIIGQLLEHRCLKWARMTHFGMGHKLWPKEGSGIKLSIWFWPLKVGNRPNLLAFRWRSTYRGKAPYES